MIIVASPNTLKPLISHSPHCSKVELPLRRVTKLWWVLLRRITNATKHGDATEWLLDHHDSIGGHGSTCPFVRIRHAACGCLQ